MKYSEQIVQDIEEGLKAGLSNKTVCDYVGITPKTFYQWAEENSNFSDRIKKAQSVKKKELLEKIEAAGANSWTAYAWILERCYHKEFGPKQELKHSGDVTCWIDLMKSHEDDNDGDDE